MAVLRRSRLDPNDRVRSAAERLTEVLDEEVVPTRKPSENREQWSAETPGHVIYIAHDELTSRRILLEDQRIGWARSEGISTPPVVDSSSDWLVYGRVPNHPLRGPACVEALCTTSTLIECATTSPPGELVPYQGWRPSRIRIATGYWSLYRSGIEVAEYRRVKRAIRSLPRDALSHGDFHQLNLLHDAARGEVLLVDWETLSYQPRFTDLMNIWPRLTDAEDRAYLLDNILGRSPDLEPLGLLHVFGALWNLNRLVRHGGRFSSFDELPEGYDHQEAALALIAEARSRATAWRG